MTPSFAFASQLSTTSVSYLGIIIDSEGTLKFFTSDQKYEDGNDKTVETTNNHSITGKIVTSKFNEYSDKYADDTLTEDSDAYKERVYGPWGNADALLIKKVAVDSSTPVSIKTMHSLFDGCSNLESVDFTGLDTSSVDRFDYLFNNCEKLTTVNLGNIDASSVESMDKMFAGCKKIVSLDMSSLNTDKLMSANGMFAGCSNLETLDISNMNNLEKVGTKISKRDFDKMFDTCYNLKEIKFNDSDEFSTTNGNSFIEFPYGYWTNSKQNKTYAWNDVGVQSEENIISGTYVRYNNIGNDYKWPTISSFLYTGNSVQPEIEQKIKAKPTYKNSLMKTVIGDKLEWDDNNLEIVYNGDFVNPGRNATVEIKGKNYLTGTKSYNITINRNSISNATVDPIPAQYYTGQELKPEPVIRLGDKILKNGVDYSLQYSENINIGQAKITITGMNNFLSYKYAYFAIQKGDSPITSNEITFRKDLYGGSYIIWKVEGKNLYIDNGSVKPSSSITKVTVSRYSSSNVLLEEGTSVSPSNIEVNVDSDGRPDFVSAKNLTWSQNSKTDTGYTKITKVSDKNTNMTVSLNNDGSCGIVGEFATITENSDGNGKITSVDHSKLSGENTYITSYRGSDLYVQYSTDGEATVLDYDKKFQRIVNGQNLVYAKFELERDNNKWITLEANGNNMSFEEDNGALYYAKIVKSINKDNNVMIFEHNTDYVNITGILTKDELKVNNASYASVLDSLDRKIHIYGDPMYYTLNFLISDDSGIAEARTTSNYIVNKIAHKLTVTTDADSYVYTGKAITPKYTVEFDGEKLDDGFVAVFSDNKNAGIGSLNISYSAKHEFSISASCDFEISKAETSTFKVIGKTLKYVYGDVKSGINASLATATGNSGKVYYEKTASSNGYVSINKDGKLVVSSVIPVGVYTISYNAIDPGDENHYGKTIFGTSTVVVNKADNTIAVKAKNAPKYKYSKKSRTLAISKLAKITNSVGELTYSKVSKGSSKYLSINKSTGKVTIKKKARKGIHNIVVNIAASGDSNYNKKNVKATLKLKIA